MNETQLAEWIAAQITEHLSDKLVTEDGVQLSPSRTNVGVTFANGAGRLIRVI